MCKKNNDQTMLFLTEVTNIENPYDPFEIVNLFRNEMSLSLCNRFLEQPYIYIFI